MDIQHPNPSESGRCQACGRFFQREANLTKHLRDNCTAAHRHSRQLWKNGTSNIKKLSALLMDSRKRLRNEVLPIDDDTGWVVQPISSMHINHGIELVSAWFNV